MHQFFKAKSSRTAAECYTSGDELNGNACPNQTCAAGVEPPACLIVLPGKSECLSPLEEKSFGHSVLNITLR